MILIWDNIKICNTVKNKLKRNKITNEIGIVAIKENKAAPKGIVAFLDDDSINLSQNVIIRNNPKNIEIPIIIVINKAKINKAISFQQV